MSLTSYLRYWYLSLRYPKRQDFVSGGLGIAARAKRVSHLWRYHLENCKDFQRKALQNRQNQSIAVLGAGRLYDVATNSLLKSCSHIGLFDADPGCLSTWSRLDKQARKVGVTTSFFVADLVNTLDVWTQAIAKVDISHSWQALTEVINNLPELRPIPLQEKNFDVVISLNLLSQIPLYWEDRVLSKTGLNKTLPVELRTAIDYSMERLQLAHLTQLNDSGAQSILLISDRCFLYYHPDKSPWQEERAIPSYTLEHLSNYRCARQESWFWHIAPYGIEQQDHGAIHDVIALQLERR